MMESQHIGEIIIQKHSQRHRALLPFSDLVSWLKQTRPAVYRNILDKYNTEAQKVYKREFDRFFSELARRAATNAPQVSVDNHHNHSSNNSSRHQQMSPLEAHTLKAYSDVGNTF
jgi:hypothetical protein